jgi:glucose/arabinose dehydrogenase
MQPSAPFLPPHSFWHNRTMRRCHAKLAIALLLALVTPPVYGAPPSSLALRASQLQVPAGFEVAVFAEKVENARSLARGARGTIFVGSRNAGVVHALIDADGDFVAEKVVQVASGLELPNGVVFHDGALYVATNTAILRFDKIEERLDSPPKPITLHAKLPPKDHHGWRYLGLGPDGKLYVAIGAPCNVCDQDDPRFASISRLNLDGSGFEVFARGIRNSVGFTWKPGTSELWFTDNGRDWSGDDRPPDELNRAERAGLHFGFPHCHGGDLVDTEHRKQEGCAGFVPPVRKLGPHVAALGVRFYTGAMFPPEYKGQLLIAEHGSWNRSKKIGYRLMRVRLEGEGAPTYEPFVSGFLAGGDVWGRPVDLLELPDGSVLVSDDYANAVYRISYRAGG